MPRYLAISLLIIVLLACGSVLATPVLDRVESDLRGALVPGSTITFIAEGSPNSRATLTIRISLGSDSPLDWKTTMKEDSPGHYFYQWETWGVDNMTVSSVQIDLKDPDDGMEASKTVSGFPASFGGVIHGVVTDNLTKLPIAGVQLMVYSPTTQHYALAHSNALGEYTLQGLGAAYDYRVWTRNGLGYADIKRDSILVQKGSTTEHVDLVLGGLAAAVGVVEDEQGHPLPGVTVKALGQDGYSRQSTKTGQDGHYCIQGLTNGGYDLIAVYDGGQAKTVIEAQAGKNSTANFRLSLAKELLSSYEVSVPNAADSDQLLYWPSQGGTVGSTSLINGLGVLSDVMSGEELTLVTRNQDGQTTYYRLVPSIDAQPNLVSIAPNDQSSGRSPQITLEAPLSTRGGTTLLYGQGIGTDWVDLWIDGLWYARLPVREQQWQTITNFDAGSHEIMAIAAGTDLPPIIKQVEVSRQKPDIQQITLNKQPTSHIYSGGSTGALFAPPKQPLEFALASSEVGESNWLVVGEQQWSMAKSDQKLTVTIPAEAVKVGRYPIAWRWEKQGKHSEMALGILVVSQPASYVLIDAITSEPLQGARAQVERLVNSQWQPVGENQLLESDANGKINIWLPEEGVFRLWLKSEGYRGQTLSLETSRDQQHATIALDPILLPCPIYLSPERGARDVNPKTPIVVAFDRDLDPRSVTPDRFYIQGVNGTITYDFYNRQLSLTPSRRLAAGAYYLVHLSGDIRYADGSPVGKSLLWPITTAAGNSSEDRSTAHRLLPANQACKLATRDGFVVANIPVAASPVQTLYKLEQPALPAAFPKGWVPVSPVVSFTAINSPLDRPVALLRQGVELTINYTEPPLEGQTTALWYYDPVVKRWEQYDSDHDAYLRSVHFVTTRPGIWVFAKQQETAQR